MYRMHDVRALLTLEACSSLATRGYVLDQEALEDLVSRRQELIRHRDKLRRARRNGGTTEEGRQIRSALGEVESELRSCESEMNDVLLGIPNVPAPDAPLGSASEPPVVRSVWGSRPSFDFKPRDHVDLGASLGILDIQRATKLSGARFSVMHGAGAKLERALIEMLLDQHTSKHGYTEYRVPHLVTPKTMLGTGQLPKFADDLFSTIANGRELLLIPTGEVPLVNLYQGETLKAQDLPLALVACTPCYRSEAGSYGRDTRGLIRLHQFDKVELVRLCHPDRASRELDVLTGHAEACLRALGLHYRVVDLRTGDLGFSARRTYDLEVWLPGQQAYREVSSCSDCGTFQARRAGIRIAGPRGHKIYAATLNGSGLPIGRTLVAILEQYQHQDGSVSVPEALVPYAGFSRIHPGGDYE